MVFVFVPPPPLAGAAVVDGVEEGVEVADADDDDVEEVLGLELPAVATTLGSPIFFFSTLLLSQQSLFREQQ